MGYYTKYSLDLVIPDTVDYDHYDVISALRTDTNAEYALDEEGSFGGECKWYYHEEDLKKFSKQFHETVFVLKGEGEDSGDLWLKYFYNGKMQMAPAQIFYDKFDPEKLK